MTVSLSRWQPGVRQTIQHRNSSGTSVRCLWSSICTVMNTYLGVVDREGGGIARGMQYPVENWKVKISVKTLSKEKKSVWPPLFLNNCRLKLLRLRVWHPGSGILCLCSHLCHHSRIASKLTYSYKHLQSESSSPSCPVFLGLLLCACVEVGEGSAGRGGDLLWACVSALNNYLLCPEYVVVPILPP